MREHLLDRIAMTLSADVQWTFQVWRHTVGSGWVGLRGCWLEA